MGIERVLTPAGDPAWRITGYDNVKTLLADYRLGRTHREPEKASRFSESAFLGEAMQGTPEEEAIDHKKFRKVLGRSFTARRMERLRPRVQEIVDDLLTELEKRESPADFHEAVSFPLPALVICELLGVPYTDREDFRRWSTEAGDMADHQRAMAGHAALQQYMHSLLERKRQSPEEDVLSDLIASEDPRRETYQVVDAAGRAAGLLFAGHETTVTAIDKGMVLLLTHPEQRAKLMEDLDLVPSTVEEILRHPLPRAPSGVSSGLPRYAGADIEFGGITIREGDLVLLDLQGANFDEAHFPDADEFDVSRQENLHLTFGHGPRFCIGAPLARIELQSLFASVFTRFPGLNLGVPVEELQPRENTLTGGLASLPVTW